uniref:Uncharacterized protein n=1 Tax=Romanomermis culicivorax TaxID=13658 RepID=A0A915J8D9_ROMCU
MDVLDILDDMDEDDIDDYVRIRTFSDSTNPLEKYSDAKFRIRYKLTKNNAIQLIALLEENLNRYTKRGRAVSAALQG